METLGKALNWIKDAGIAAADWVEDHPWKSLGAILGLGLALFAALVAGLFS